MSAYFDNLNKAKQLVTRNSENIQAIEKISFWLNDVNAKMGLSWVSVPNWLKIRQNSGHECSFFPVDGTEGVFRKEGLQVSDNSRFVYDNFKGERVLVVPSFFSFPKHKASFSRKIRFLKLFNTELKEITNDGNTSYDLF